MKKNLSYKMHNVFTREKFCTTCKELLTEVWFMRYFRPYLYRPRVYSSNRLCMASGAV